jgi:GT2 family glycosyltransferase
VTDLSIVIVTWNSLDVLEGCLQSIEREVLSRQDEGRIEVETIVVDNDSQDATAKVVSERYGFADLVRLDRNRGFAGGNNVGLRRARGRHAVLLNNDTLVRRDGLEACVRHLDAHPDVGVVGPQLTNADGSKQNCVHNYPSLVTEIVPKGLLETIWPSRFPSKRFAHAAPYDVQAVIGACLVVRREVLEQVGLMPEDYFFFMEETDWCYRIRRAGWRIVHLPDVEIVHLHGVSSKKRMPAETRIEYHRSLYRFFRKNRGAGQAAAVVGLRVLKAILYVLVDLPRALTRRGRERWRTRWTVLCWHLHGCPSGWGLGPRASEEST